MTKLIAVDLGTTLVKCTLFEESGRTLASESLPCGLTYPAQDRAEQDAELWYTGVCDAIARLVAACGPEEIRGLSISSQGISVVPVDDQFRPLRTALSWLDVRADEECSLLAKALPVESWFRKTGKFLGPGYTLPKLLWLRRNEPEIFSAASKFLLPMDYVNARMTGHAVTDHTMAAGTMAYDVTMGDWDPALLALAGLTPDHLAQIQPSGALVGPINEETARRTGLPRETLVFNGGQDQKVAAFGAEIDAKRGSLSLGTAGALEIFVKDAASQSLLPFFPYTVPGQTLVEGCVNTAGAAIQWLKDTVCPDISFDELNRLAAASPVGSSGVRFYPHLSRPGTPHRGRSEYGSIRELSLGVTRGDLIRCLYEGLAYEFRLNLEYARQAGSELEQLILFGGASKSPVFCQIIADVTGLKIEAAENGEMGGIGAAKLSAQGLGLDSIGFARAAAGSTKQYLPDPDAVRLYDSLYQQYIETYRSEE